MERLVEISMKNYITIAELLILAQMNKSFSINGFDDNTFLDILCRNNEYYCFYVSKDNCPINFQYNNFVDLKDDLSKHLANIFFNRSTLNLWNKKSA